MNARIFGRGRESNVHRGYLTGAISMVLSATLTLLGGCSTTAPAASRQVAAPQPRYAAPVARYNGPKKTIAVTKFDAHGAFLARYGGWDIGGGLAAQLSSALSHSDQFLLVERATLPGVLREQELGLRGLTTANTAPRAGQLIGAQLLIRGSVTEFNQRDGGGGFSIGGPLSNSFSGAISPRVEVGHVAIDFRVIDTTTGRVVATHTSRGEIRNRSIALSGVGSNLNFSSDAFQSTALGEATRAAIGDAVRYIEASMASVPWSAQVAKVRDGQVYLTAGANANLRTGSTLSVYAVADRVVDPTTGELLGTEEFQVGTLVVEHIQPRFARGSFIGAEMPRTGDIVRFEPGRVISGFRSEPNLN